MYESMQGLTNCLAFTAETAEDFADGWLPTLDFKLRVNAKNIIEYAFYEKPTASNRCLQADTALNHNCLIRSLSNEVMRRMDSFSSSVGIKERVIELDRFSQNMANSGHTVKTIRSILVSGIKGYKRRVARSVEQNIPLHRSAGQSAATRRTKKLLAKSNWFRQDKSDTESEERPEGISEKRRGTTGGQSSQGGKDGAKDVQLRTTTVMFVEFTRGGMLQKLMRDTMDRLTPMLKFKVKVAEKGGTTLGSLLSNKNLWSGQECGRTNCRTCAQPGDKKEPCTTRNVLYESECAKCNPPGTRKVADRDGLAEKRDVASLYVGESARSISERALEHWRDAESGKE